MGNHIMLGTQLHAPEGFKSLLQGVTYHFLNRTGGVRLVQFVERDPVRIGVLQRIDRPPPEVHILELCGDEFDQAIWNRHIQVKPIQAILPPWSQALKETVQGRDQGRYAGMKIAHLDRVAALLRLYQPLLLNLNGILSAPSPIKVLNRFARDCKPEQNQKRFRAEFIAFVLFGQNTNVIAYQTQNIGKWERIGHSGKKAGIKALGVGALHGFKSSDEQLIEDVKEAWHQWGRLGATQLKIYRKLCTQIWKTSTIKDQRGVKRLIRTDGGPFLTYDQFCYRLELLEGKSAIQERLRGRAYVREELLPSTGRFSEAVANIGERAEADGYWLEEVCIGPDGVNPLPSVVVVRVIDLATGMFLGIGFSLGGESAAAYRMAMFCSAVPKSFFGRLVGLVIDDEAWPSIGLCDDTVTDRGAGGGNSAKASTDVGNPVISSMPPTGFGQGKASIESSNRREVKIRDRPTHKVTKLPLIELVRREIKDTVTLNDARDISAHLTLKRIMQADRITPLDLHNKLAEVGRNHLRPIPVDDAIRSFLTPVRLVAKQDGIYCGFQRYTSEKLKEAGILNSAASSGEEIALSGYMLDASIRYCFLDWRGSLIELAGVLPLREDEEQLYVSLYELQALDQKLKVMKSDFRSHCEGAFNEAEREFKEQTGFEMDESKLKMGPAKRRTARAKGQGKMVKDMLTHPKKAA
jgi:hypothetical protein